jgi:hypothetical protein
VAGSRPSLARDPRGAGTVQMLILAVSLALAGAVSVRVLSSAIGERARCTGDEIRNMAVAPCGEAGDGRDGQAPPPPDPAASDEGDEGDDGDDGGGEGDEEFDLGKELLDLAADLIGFTDAKKCVTEGDILACIMTALNFTPGKVFGLAFKVFKNIKRIEKLLERLQRARKAKEAAEKCAGGKCDKPGVCFAPGTLVQAEGGPAPIEALGPGDRVWSRDDRTGEAGYRAVVRTFATPDQPLLAVALEDERGAVETLEVTAPHPFRVAGRGWVAAGDLRAGDPVDGAGGRLRVAGVDETGRSTTVYNLEVAEFHTYFVGRGAAWVHNQCKEPKKKKKEEEKPGKKDKKTGDKCKGDGDCARGHCHTKRNGEQVCVDCTPKQIDNFLGIKDRFCKNEDRHCRGRLDLDADPSEFTRRIDNADRCIQARNDENQKCFAGGDRGHQVAVREAEIIRATCVKMLEEKRTRDLLRRQQQEGQQQPPRDPNAPGT